MTMKLLVAMLLMSAVGVGIQPGPPKPHIDYANCTSRGGTGNQPNPQDSSKIFECDGVQVELHGRWTQVVEYGNVYRENLGEIEGKPVPATEFDRDFFKWCRRDERQVEMCGWNPKWKHGQKISEHPWNPNPNDFEPIGARP